MRINAATAAGLQVLTAADYMGTVDAGGTLGLFGCTIWTTPSPHPPRGRRSGMGDGLSQQNKQHFSNNSR